MQQLNMSVKSHWRVHPSQQIGIQNPEILSQERIRNISDMFQKCLWNISDQYQGVRKKSENKSENCHFWIPSLYAGRMSLIYNDVLNLKLSLYCLGHIHIHMFHTHSPMSKMHHLYRKHIIISWWNHGVQPNISYPFVVQTRHKSHDLVVCHHGYTPC